MRIAATASAFPKYRYSQKQLLDGLGQYWAEQLDEPRMLQRLHMNMGVDDRYLSLPMKAYEGLDSWGQANDVWIETSLELAERTLCCALARAGFAPDRLGALFFVSITGVASPSIDARLMNRMSLPANLKRIPVFGLGCVG